MHRLGYKTRQVRTPAEMSGLDGIVLPGGESTALLKLADAKFRSALTELVQSGCPTLATCAGVILLATEVQNPQQESLGLLDVTVSRNAYGRQIDSFIDTKLPWTEEGELALTACKLDLEPLEAVFIRAPRISRTGPYTKVLADLHGEPVLVQQGHVFGATFHPELGEKPSVVHRLFLQAQK